MEEKQNEEEILGETLDFTKPTFEFIPKGSHEWRQQGPYIICKSCELEHATYIGMDKQMIGINEGGQPIFKEVSIL